jgi:hypothetical protein
MPRFDWLLSGVLVAAVLWSAHRLTRELSSRLARWWLRLESAPWLARWGLWTVLVWFALRLARWGWRALVAYTVFVGGTLIWAAAAARLRRA